MVIGQPAEERRRGRPKASSKDGLSTRFPARITRSPCTSVPITAVGRIGNSPGLRASPNVDSVHITEGRGGHGRRLNTTIEPITQPQIWFDLFVADVVSRGNRPDRTRQSHRGSIQPVARNTHSPVTIANCNDRPEVTAAEVRESCSRRSASNLRGSPRHTTHRSRILGERRHPVLKKRCGNSPPGCDAVFSDSNFGLGQCSRRRTLDGREDFQPYGIEGVRS